jgi:hypothetical protein
VTLHDICVRIVYPRPDNSLENQEVLALNKNLFESKWKQIRDRTTAWWSLMSDIDLVKVDKAENKFDKYVTLLQVKYGYTRDHAKKELSRRVTEYETELKNTDKAA